MTNDGEYFVVVPPGAATIAGAATRAPTSTRCPPQGADGNQTDNLLAALHLQPTGDAIPVSREWINLFPTGAPLDWSSFEITGSGSRRRTPATTRPASSATRSSATCWWRATSSCC